MQRVYSNLRTMTWGNLIITCAMPVRQFPVHFKELRHMYARGWLPANRVSFTGVSFILNCLRAHVYEERMNILIH